MIDAIKRAREAAVFLHNNPEESFKEYKTSEYIRNFCKEAGLDMVDIGIETGVTAVINMGLPGSVAIRADIDAVPTDNGPKHICGHDYHTAALIGTADYLSRNRDKLKYNVLFIFQPAEECTSGARKMTEAGVFEKSGLSGFIGVFGIHNRPEIDCGLVAVHKGYLMAEKSNFVCRITGKTGHGGEPHNCVDPMVAVGAFISGAQTIVSRNVDPNEAAVCSVLSVSCGDTDNFVPETALLTGSIRSFDHDTHLRMRKRLQDIAVNTAHAYECSCDFSYDLHVPAVNNDENLYKTAYETAVRTVGESRVTDTDPALGSDDFAVFGERMPMFYYWVGSGVPGKNSAPWHKPDFRVDDNYLDIATPLLINIAI